MEKINQICQHFALPHHVTEIKPLGNGLINSTYRIACEDGSLYVLQQINTAVFREPEALMENIIGVCSFMADKVRAEGGDVARETMQFIAARDGNYFYSSPEHGFWRMYRYIDDVSAYDAPDKKGLLFEAAYAFGLFQRRLGDYPAKTLHETIHNFHNTAARYEVFEQSLKKDVANRAAGVAAEVEAIVSFRPYASAITSLLADGTIPTRVTHNDTKLNNVLIDNETGRGICVIDLDTVMPGSLLYDFGDSIRFAANNTFEDDPDLSRVWLDLSRYEEYVSGFLRGVGDAITEKEKELLPLSAFILTYELAIRFMTDYLDGDVYFKKAYPEHNLVRTRAQIKLMQDIFAKLDEMSAITAKY